MSDYTVPIVGGGTKLELFQHLLEIGRYSRPKPGNPDFQMTSAHSFEFTLGFKDTGSSRKRDARPVPCYVTGVTSLDDKGIIWQVAGYTNLDFATWGIHHPGMETCTGRFDATYNTRTRKGTFRFHRR